MIQPVGREGISWPSQQRQPSSARASTACKHTGMPRASPWLVMNKKTKPNHCWKRVLAEVYPQHCSDNNNQTSELTTTHQNWEDTNVCEGYDRVWVTYYEKINQKYPTCVKVAMVKKANSCCWGREPPVGMYTALYLICSVNHSLHFFGTCSRWKLLSPVTLVRKHQKLLEYTHSTWQYAIATLKTIHIDFNIHSKLHETCLKQESLLDIFRSLYLSLDVVCYWYSNFSPRYFMKYLKDTVRVSKPQTYTQQLPH